jgi:hypothetical protein
MLGGGKCQSRKTPLKLCTFLMCRMLGVPTVLLTTNNSGRDDLFRKFLALVENCYVPHPEVAEARNPIVQLRYQRYTRNSMPTLKPAAGQPSSIVLNIADIKVVCAT